MPFPHCLWCQKPLNQQQIIYVFGERLDKRLEEIFKKPDGELTEADAIYVMARIAERIVER